jgi:hypothetical protein
VGSTACAKRRFASVAIAADVIVVVIRIHDRGELDVLAFEVCEHRRGVAGIDDGGHPPSRSNQM